MLYWTLEFVFNLFFFSPLGPRDLDTQVRIINTTIKTTSVCDGDARSVGGGRGWLAGDTDGLAGWLMTGDGGRCQPASSRRWAVQVRVCLAWRPVLVRPRLQAF